MIGADSTINTIADRMSKMRFTAVRNAPWLNPSPKISQLALR